MSNKISFAGLITTITEDTQETRSYTRQFVSEMALVIREGLLRDGAVSLSGFGVFKLHDVPQRNGRNIQTGNPLVIPAHRKVMFKPEKSLRELINKRYAHLRPQIIDQAAATGGTVSKEAPQREATGSFFSSVFADDDPASENMKEKISTIGEVPAPYAPAPKKEKKNIKEPAVAVAPDEPLSPPTQTESPEIFKNETDPEKKSKRGMYLSILAILLVLVVYWQMQTNTNIDEKTAEQSSVDNPRHVTKNPAVVNKSSQTTQDETVRAPLKKPPQNNTLANTVVFEKEIRHTSFGDNLWKLAYQHYHDGYLWPLILLENHDKINNPDFVKTGLDLVVPALTIKDKKLGKATRRLLAKGHMLAYASFKARGREEAVNHLYAANKYDSDYVRSMAAQIDNADLLAIHVK